MNYRLTSAKVVRKLLPLGFMGVVLTLPISVVAAQVLGAESLHRGLQVQSVEHNEWNDVRIELSTPVDCGYGPTRFPVILDNHVGQAKRGMLSVLMSGFLSGRSIDLSLVRYRLGNNDHCSVRRVRVR